MSDLNGLQILIVMVSLEDCEGREEGKIDDCDEGIYEAGGRDRK